ncbi:MAG: DUF3052 family protein [Longimicrobiales bacterium]
MGKEANCTARYNGATSAGKLQLETDHLVFRGDFRIKLTLKELKRAAATRGQLRVEGPNGAAVFELGAVAQAWAEAINNPKSLLDKLGIKAEHAVSVIGITDRAFLDDLERRTSQVTDGKAVMGSDVIVFQADEPHELKALASLAKSMKRDGAIWVVTPKKRPEIADTVVMKAGKSAGLVDVKVARFSETYTALKFVIPKDKR